MKKSILIIVLAIVIGVGGYFVYRAIFSNMEKMSVGIPDKPGKSEFSYFNDFEWVAIDQDYKPKHPAEKIVKKDAELEDLYPTEIINHGKNTDLLEKFKGMTYAGLTEDDIEEYWKDWAIVDIRYKDKEGREIYSRILFLKYDFGWAVADHGTIN